jgi:tripartite ATP-independent transporter DctM subunit
LLGPIIPPSIPMVVYGQIANQSVIKLFMSGVVPGLMLAAGFMVLCTIIANRRNYAADMRANWVERGRATQSAGWALLMPVIIILGIRFGVVTDTEAAAVAALYALLVGLFIYRTIGFRNLPGLLAVTGKSSGAILFLLAAAGPFSWLVAESQVGAAVTALILRSRPTRPAPC